MLLQSRTFPVPVVHRRHRRRLARRVLLLSPRQADLATTAQVAKASGLQVFDGRASPAAELPVSAASEQVAPVPAVDQIHLHGKTRARERNKWLLNVIG
jgi:hypothetical protein